MSDWYYLSNGQQQGPVPSSTLKQLVDTGALTPEDMVWKEGMPNWVKAGTVNGLFSHAAAPAGQVAAAPSYAPAPAQANIGYYAPTGASDVNLNRQGLEMLRQTKPWVRFIAVLMFIFSGLILVFGLFSLVGFAAMSRGRGTVVMTGSALVYIAMGALYMIPAVFLNRYASRIGTLLIAPQDQGLTSALEAQKSFWKFVGILTLVVLCLYLLALAVLFIGFLR